MYAINVKKLSSVRVSRANRNYLEVVSSPYQDQLQLVRHAVKLILPTKDNPSGSSSYVLTARDLNHSIQSSDNNKVYQSNILNTLVQDYGFDRIGTGFVRGKDEDRVQELYADLEPLDLTELS